MRSYHNTSHSTTHNKLSSHIRLYHSISLLWQSLSHCTTIYKVCITFYHNTSHHVYYMLFEFFTRGTGSFFPTLFYIPWASRWRGYINSQGIWACIPLTIQNNFYILFKCLHVYSSVCAAKSFIINAELSFNIPVIYTVTQYMYMHISQSTTPYHIVHI